MRFTAGSFLLLIKEAATKWNEHNCLRLAASLSYYSLLSLFPLILVVLFIIGVLIVNSDDARNAVLDALASVTGGFRDDFVSALEAAIRTRGTSGVIGAALLVLGSSWVFGELVSAFNIIWDIQAPSSGGPLHLVRVTFLSFALVLAVAFLLLVSMIITAVLTLLGQFMSTLPGGAVLWGGVHIFINLTVLTLIFAVLFKYLPQTYVAWGDVWLGAGLTAIAWSLLQLAISYYITLSSYKDYGSVGAVLALITWVYLSSLILFAGGEFSAAFARNYGSRAHGGRRIRRHKAGTTKTPRAPESEELL